MKLIANWKAIAARSHSMWAVYLGLIVLWAPEFIFAATGMDTDPRRWMLASSVLFVYGGLGRVKDQGIDRTTTRSPIWVGLIVLAFLGWVTSENWRLPAPIDATAATSASTEEAGPSVEVAPDGSAARFMPLAIEVIGKWEGLRLESYQDVVGVWTVCFGETKGVKPGDRYTKAECEAMLAREIVRYRAAMHGHFTAETKARRLPVKRDVAFTSFGYNVGPRAAGGSTATRRLNAGNVRGACEALGWWNKAGGRVYRGLVNRRAEETALCLDGLA